MTRINLSLLLAINAFFAKMHNSNQFQFFKCDISNKMSEENADLSQKNHATFHVIQSVTPRVAHIEDLHMSHWSPRHRLDQLGK